MFFVLSGFLVGNWLLASVRVGPGRVEHSIRSGSSLWQQFLRRRARRLIPALVACVGVVGIVVAAGYPDDPNQWTAWWRGGLGGLTGTANWVEMVTQRDYFASSGRGAVFGHLWSLGVEMQAYLLLAVLVPVVWRLVGFRCAEVFAVLATLSYSWQAVVATAAAKDGSMGGGHAYFGTDTRIGAVFLGVATAAFVRRSASREPVLFPWVAEAIVSVALLGLLLLFVHVEGTDLSLYRGWFCLTALSTAVVIGASCVASQQGISTRAAWLLGSPPMRWLGSRSYGVYLWHWPVFVMTRPIAGVPMSAWGFAQRVVLVAILSEVSFTWIETTPVTAINAMENWRFNWHINVPRLVVPLRIVPAPRRAAELVGAAMVGSVITLVATLGAVTSAAAPAASRLAPVPLASGIGELIPVSADPSSTTVGAPTTLHISSNEQLPESTLPSTALLSTALLSTTVLLTTLPSTVPATTFPPLVFDPANVTIIGDSVLQAASPALRARLGQSIVIDAKIGRQFVQAGSVVDGLRVEGRLRAMVVVALGTNGPFNDAAIDGLIAQLADRELVAFVMVKAPRRWEGKVNQTLRRAQERHPNVIVIDWPTVVQQRRLRLPDGVHPAPVAASVYAELLVGALSGAVQAWPCSSPAGCSTSTVLP